MELKKILVTGGAGFIGSNLVASLILDERVDKIIILDNLATGFQKNLDPFLNHGKVEFFKGDIRDYDTCIEVTKNIDIISHQAALGSVPRSIKDPLTSNEVNINGTLNIFYAAIQNKVKRVVFAASSSTYGDSPDLPKVEEKIGKPLSPYAVTKYVNELYADVFSKVYAFEYIGLRYFNVFGPNQDPFGAYAAVIPLFMHAATKNENVVINGDGENSRDFTYIDNAVEANIKAMFIHNSDAINQVYNIACGERTSLNELWAHIKEISGTRSESLHGPNREGDIPHSLADISKAKNLLEYKASIKIKEGLTRTYNWYKNNIVAK